MTANLLYVIGFGAAWAGIALLLLGIFRVLAKHGNYLWGLGAGGFLLLISAATPVFRAGIGIPLVWVLMPFAGWGCLTSLLWFLYACVKGFLNSSARQGLRGFLGIGVAAVFVWFYRLDPENRIEVIQGHIGLSPVSALALGALLLTALGLMATVGRKATDIGSRIAVHAMLLVGSLIFGLPFAWLLVTSFKEDRDMSSAHGLVWIPRVQRTYSYRDSDNPLLEGVYKGNWVQTTVSGRTAQGAYIVEVQRPSSLRGISFSAPLSAFKVVPEQAPVVAGDGFTGFVVRELNDGRRLVQFLTPNSLVGKRRAYLASQLDPVRDIGLRTQNYVDALEAMPPETDDGLVYLKNTLILVVLGVIGTLASSSIVAYGFARLRFPGREALFKVLLATMMLPGAVTLMPQFLLFRSFGWIDTLYPLWVPAFFGSAFNVFLLRQFFSQVPGELEDAGKIDGAGVLRTFWSIMIPQIKPALAVVAIWTFMGAWNNFMGPLLYIDTPENMPLSYALQLFQSERGGEPGMMMAFATLTIIPVVALFFFAQKYFVEGVSLSGLGGR